jgi:hypothetical protein
VGAYDYDAELARSYVVFGKARITYCLTINHKAPCRVACISNGTQINGTTIGFTKHNLMARQGVIGMATQSPAQAMSTAMVWMI